MDYRTRKHVRLKHYDYSQAGAYHVNIHISGNAPLLSTICEERGDYGETVYPRENLTYPGGFKTELKPFGQLLLNNMFEMVLKYSAYEIRNYVIMPTHIHLLLIKTDNGEPTICSYVGQLKSKTTIQFNKKYGTAGTKLFQDSFYEHIIRGESDLQDTLRYIDNNPLRWSEKKT